MEISLSMPRYFFGQNKPSIVPRELSYWYSVGFLFREEKEYVHFWTRCPTLSDGFFF
jgi:hypothetical protein